MRIMTLGAVTAGACALVLVAPTSALAEIDVEESAGTHDSSTWSTKLSLDDPGAPGVEREWVVQKLEDEGWRTVYVEGTTGAIAIRPDLERGEYRVVVKTSGEQDETRTLAEETVKLPLLPWWLGVELPCNLDGCRTAGDGTDHTEPETTTQPPTAQPLVQPKTATEELTFEVEGDNDWRVVESEWEQISTGMTREEVTDTVGFEGWVRFAGDGTERVEYPTMKEDSGVLVTYRNGVATAKTRW